MSIKVFYKNLRNEYRNFRGKRVNKRYLLIESDDWGSIRQPSFECYQEQCLKSELTNKDPFFHYDALESDKDMTMLFDVLRKHVDYKGKHAIIAANYAVTNPDFDAIRKNKYSEYQFETIDKTYEKYEGSENVLKIAKQGMEEGIWMPQLHCREHVQIERWMDALRKTDPEIVWAFNHNMISTAWTINKENPYGYMDAFNYSIRNSIKVEKIIEDATREFETLFGYKSNTFVASCYVWNSMLEKHLHKYGINNMQASWYQWIPSEDTNGLLKKKHHYNGEIIGNNLYTVRNCLLEHSLYGTEMAVQSCLAQIESAFRWNQPAIISSHRVNYTGRISEDNRNKGLKILDEVLGEVCCRWPDVEFITSVDLAKIYRDKGNMRRNISEKKNNTD